MNDNTTKQLLLGDEAIALGAIHAGLSGVYAYPGTPSTEITEYIQQHPTATERGIYSNWCTNEKTAMEAALGMSYAGKRALVCMKHVGLNVAADAFVNSALTGVNGGLVVLVADDPSMHSSQNEQDSRFYGRFSLMPILEPSSQQEAYDMMAYAYQLSEQNKLPILMRITTRMAHSRAVVTLSKLHPQNECNNDALASDWILLPAIARRRYANLVAMQPQLEEQAAHSPFSSYAAGSNTSRGIIACGLAYNYVMEHYPNGCPYPLLKVSQYPLPQEKVRQMAELCDELLVVEDGYPLVEELIGGILPTAKPIKGRLTGDLPRMGELTPDNVAIALGVSVPEQPASPVVVARPPALCAGCGHRDVYDVLNQVIKEEYPTAKVFGDIGCYTLGALPPFRAIDSCVDMGASITMAKGAADAGLFPAIAVIGDSTFTHSGMTGLLDAANTNAPITVILSDNLTTAMTGGQDSAGTYKFEAICTALGVPAEHVRVVVPLPKNMEEIKQVIREEIAYQGTSVIIPRRECIQTLTRKHKEKKVQQA
ncbi:MAG: thiamine pyrophosphate-dependent enzyme [Phocaeicola sp.]